MIAVGSGGDYLQHSSTFQNCRSLYLPEVSDWNSFEDWKKAGERDLLRIAHEKCSRILEKSPAMVLSAEVDEEIEAYVRVVSRK
jgi:trimethylamine--corrinoid protein Co-methyltransferase